MKNKTLINIAVTSFLSVSSMNLFAHDFTLQGGAFYGPGDNGVHQFPLGSLNNYIPTGELEGYIPFFNNGSAPPNVPGEELQDGAVVDGMLSDGTLLNENLRNGFIINTNNEEYGFVSMLVAAVEGGPTNGVETFQPDEKGNLTIRAYSAFDIGDGNTSRLLVIPTTGSVRIPLSTKTQMGLEGGNDFAGPYPSGRIFVGKLGDFDQDGYLDGEVVLGQNSPFDLIIAEGDPVYFNRPFTSDIPIDAYTSSILTLNGIVQNFDEAVTETVSNDELDLTFGYLSDITLRIDAALTNLRRAKREDGLDYHKKFAIYRSQYILVNARKNIHAAITFLEKGDTISLKKKYGLAISRLAESLSLLSSKK